MKNERNKPRSLAEGRAAALLSLDDSQVRPALLMAVPTLSQQDSVARKDAISRHSRGTCSRPRAAGQGSARARPVSRVQGDRARDCTLQASWRVPKARFKKMADQADVWTWALPCASHGAPVGSADHALPEGSRAGHPPPLGSRL